MLAAKIEHRTTDAAGRADINGIWRARDELVKVPYRWSTDDLRRDVMKADQRRGRKPGLAVVVAEIHAGGRTNPPGRQLQIVAPEHPPRTTIHPHGHVDGAGARRAGLRIDELPGGPLVHGTEDADRKSGLRVDGLKQDRPLVGDDDADLRRAEARRCRARDRRRMCLPPRGLHGDTAGTMCDCRTVKGAPWAQSMMFLVAGKSGRSAGDESSRDQQGARHRPASCSSSSPAPPRARTSRPTRPKYPSLGSPVAWSQTGLPVIGLLNGHAWKKPTHGVPSGAI